MKQDVFMNPGILIGPISKEIGLNSHLTDNYSNWIRLFHLLKKFCLTSTLQ